MKKPLPICVIGAGLIGTRHVEVALKSDFVDLVAVVEADEARRIKLTESGLSAVATVDDLLKNVRAAVIATPTPAHYENSMSVLDKGLGVLLEKPVAATLGEARAIVDAFEKASIPLVVGHHRRCHPFTVSAREELSSLGDLVGVQGFWSLRKNDSYFDPLWRRKPGAGPLMINLIHEIDLLNFLIGEISEVTALTSSTRRKLEIEDTASLALRFENGALGSFLISDAGASPWSFEAGTSENPNIAGTGQDYIKISGTRASMEFPSRKIWRADYSGEVEWGRGLSQFEAPAYNSIDPILAQMERFAAVIDGAHDDVLCTGSQGILAMEMTLATALSAKLGKPVSRGEVPQDFRGI